METIRIIESPEPIRLDEGIVYAASPVVIHVAGGGVQLISKPVGVTVEIHDFDTLSETGESIRQYAAGQVVREGRETGG